MPTYEYKCEACGVAFERFQSITAPAIKTCPQCHKPKVKRLISGGAGLIFKGSGFYITDYRSDGYKKAAAGESSTSSTGSGTVGASGASNSASGNGAAPSSPAPSSTPGKKSAAKTES